MRKALLIDELVAAVVGTDRQLDEHVVSTVAAAAASLSAAAAFTASFKAAAFTAIIIKVITELSILSL